MRLLKKNFKIFRHLREENDLMCALVEEIFQDIPFWKILSGFVREKSMI
jgi:hypothetical protein